jgi:DNA-binding transcriptional MerR regulator
MGTSADDRDGNTAEPRDAEVIREFSKREVCEYLGLDPDNRKDLDRVYDWTADKRSNGRAIVPPSIAPYRGSGRGRDPMFSLSDLTLLRVVRRLDAEGASTHMIREAFNVLRDDGINPMNVTLQARGKGINLVDLDSGQERTLASRTRELPGQGALILVQEEYQKLEAEVRALSAEKARRDLDDPDAQPAVEQAHALTRLDLSGDEQLTG